MGADDTSPDVRLPGPNVERAVDLLRACEAELETKPESAVAARIHYHMAVLYERNLADLGKARVHFQQSLKLARDRLASVVGARRVCLAMRDYRGALPLFDSEVALVSDPRRKALLLYEKGCLLENHFHDMRRAREAYAAALDFDRNDATVLKALERCDLVVGERRGLRRTYELLPNAITADSAHRAALLVKRVRFADNGDARAAIDCYESALRLAPTTPGAREALKRLYHQGGHYPQLVDALIADANETSDENVRAAVLYELGNTHERKLRQRSEAIEALAIAAEVSRDDYLVLGDLAHLYEAAREWRKLVDLLTRLVELAGEDRQRVALLVRLGQLHETRLENELEAVKCYSQALALDPSYRPGLQALGKLHMAAGDWGALINMHLAEAEATQDPQRRADAHARVAEIYETRLNRPADAARQHERALELVPSYPASFKALARLYEHAQLYRELIELHERALDQAPSNVHRVAHLFKIGWVWENALNQPGQAIHSYRRILDLDRDHLGAVHALQRAAEAAEDWGELVEALELEAAKTSDQAVAVGLLHRAGTVHDERLNDVDAARSRFRRVLELDPAFVPALASLGRIYYRAGRWNDLLQMYRRELDATADGPDAVSLLYRMAELCEEKLGKPQKAVEYLRRAVKLDPSHQPSLLRLSRNLEAMRDWPGVAELLSLQVEALTSPAERAACSVRLGQVYEDRVADEAKAIAAYKAALDDRPGYRPALDALVRLYSARGDWRMLVEALELDESTTTDPNRVAAALLYQAEIWRDRLNDAERAIECLDRLIDVEPGHLEALLSLEELHLRARNREALARIYARQAEVLRDPGARVAALRELARLLETEEVVDVEALVAAYEAVLSIVPDDPQALQALERLFSDDANHAALGDVAARLGSIADDDELASYHLTVQAQASEAAGDVAAALGAYVAAARHDNHNITALRSAAQLAEVTEDLSTLADALRAEARVTRRKQAAADLLVRSADIAARRGNKPAAIDDLRRALELWPDNQAAADNYGELLLEGGRVEELIDVLSRAAGSAQDSQRVAQLWQTVAELYAYRLDNLGAGIATLTRALKADPSNAQMMGALADLYAYSRQWNECVDLLERMRSFTKDAAASREVLLVLARVYDEHLGEHQKAIDRANEVLSDEPDNLAALTRMADVQLRKGDLSAARAAIKTLIKASADRETLVSSLMKLADVEAEHGGVDAALAALADAVILDGPRGDAAERFKGLVRGPGDWNWYTRSLTEHIKRGDNNPLELGGTYLELAMVQADELASVDAAIATLRKGIDATGGDSALVMELARRLRWAGRGTDAIKHLRGLLAERPTRAETWRALSLTLAESRREDEATLALEPLVVLDAANEEEQQRVDRRAAGYGRARPGSFSTRSLEAIAVDNSLSIAALTVTQALSPLLPKLLSDGLEELGLSRRDRIAPRTPHAVRGLADELAPIFGVEEFDLYEHAAAQPLVSVEAASVPSVVVSEAIADLSEAQQVFLLAHALCMVAGGFFVVEKLGVKEVGKLLTATGRTMVSGFGAGEDVDDYADKIRRAVPRRSRKEFENTARFYVSQPCPNVKTWVTALKKTALRAALIACDDLAAAVALIQKTSNLPKDISGHDLVARSPLIAEMMQFWVSDQAMAFRRTCGMLGRLRTDLSA